MIKFYKKKKEILRPTTQKIVESLINILGESVKDSRILELYAGTARFSLEAVRRGAVEAVIVEKDREIMEEVRKKTVKLGFQDKIKFIKSNVVSYLCGNNDTGYDIIFMDPPYDSDEYQKAIRLIEEKKKLNNSGQLIVEHYHKVKLPDSIGFLMKKDVRKYGQTVISFYERVG